MTTPSINTPNAIIADAYMDAGLLMEGQTPNSEQLASGMRRLRDVINFLQTEGLKLWLNQDITVPIVAGQMTYTFKPSGSVDMTKPLRVLEAYYLYDSDNTRRPLTVMALSDYWTLGQAGTLTANRGTITQYLVNKFAAELSVTFWQCPNDEEEDNGDVHLLMQVQVTNPISLTETMEFPEEWRMALRWGLAADICTGQPQAVIDRCEGKALYYKNALEAWDVEDAPTRFAVDTSRGGYQTGGFR